MKRTPDTSNARRAVELAIISAFFLPGSASHIARCFSTMSRKLSSNDVRRIWSAAKKRGDLPKLNRPHGGPRDRETIRDRIFA